MNVGLLDPARVAELQAQALTYREVGATATAAPGGYLTFTRSAVLTSTDFAASASALMSWQVQVRSGLRVTASSDAVARGAVVTLRLGLGPLAVTAPCRVVYVINEADRQGFAYGTLPGHPESGEESFVLHRAERERVIFTVSAFSRPATTMANLAGVEQDD